MDFSDLLTCAVAYSGDDTTSDKRRLVKAAEEAIVMMKARSLSLSLSLHIYIHIHIQVSVTDIA